MSSYCIPRFSHSHWLSLLFLVVVGSSHISCGSNEKGTASLSGGVSIPQVRPKAPLFKLTDISGKSLALADLKGKVVFLDFWATWCPPCVMASPQIQKMSADYKEKDVIVLSISLDQDESMVKAFVSRHKITNKVALVGSSGMEIAYDVQGIPAFFMIDKKGYLVQVWEGYHPAMPVLWRKELDRLLKA